MGKKKDKRTAKKPLTSDDKPANVDENHNKSEIILTSSTEREVERQIAAVKAISDMEVDHLLTGLHLIRSYFSEEQLQMPVLEFFKENLPNVEVVKNSQDEHFDLRRKNEAGNVYTNTTDGRDIHASLFHHMSMAYPSVSAAGQSFDGLQFSAKTVKNHVPADDLQFGNYLSQESFNTAMLGMPEGLQTPGATSQRLSVGMTPKTVRLPKHGEMLLSVHGSPLGVYKEDDMEAIHEVEEG
ncbi:uncharacterized protein LOC141595085 [Silene latifolia]|uniref:uncharacterized protein LOC141595085 n=1 Tax=Silene latifolia TaxID=37657 RepID=UPI003D77BA58